MAGAEAGAAGSEQLIMKGFRTTAATIGEAAEVVLAAAEAQPTRMPSAALLRALCTAVKAFFGVLIPPEN